MYVEKANCLLKIPFPISETILLKSYIVVFIDVASVARILHLSVHTTKSQETEQWDLFLAYAMLSPQM